ncbi:hypothetical protein FOZ62_029644, partial [Perkinsus olseni]
NAFVVYYSVFKNAGFSLLPFVYGIVCAFSATNVYHVVLKQFYNTFFTALPVVAYAVFDHQGALAAGPGRPRFGAYNLAVWTLRGLWCAFSFCLGSLLPFTVLFHSLSPAGIYSVKGYAGMSTESLGLMATANSVIFFNAAIYIWSSSRPSHVLYAIGTILFIVVWVSMDQSVFSSSGRLYLCSPMGVAAVLLSLSLAGLSLFFVLDSRLARFMAVEESMELQEVSNRRVAEGGGATSSTTAAALE